ncbi:helix-turn-helix domain-containing protein [Streptomyces sp. NBC_01242]|uniref:MarR family winged helix-turn-helix transcriptional regulator n=1 Tax=Streptomyces sp. NBC_01242 TaxID=2903795 RepID=UPI00224FDA90|nr:helix-turn-helix domain-containing protein [Streptomyces sp. NBC_01242]MCX4799535.1 helix-turn-helix domain-containing protein [Streptomyces sp. NBC_01242]
MIGPPSHPKKGAISVPRYFNVSSGPRHAKSDANLTLLPATVTLRDASTRDLQSNHWARRFPALSPRMAMVLIDGDTGCRYGSTDASSLQSAKSKHGHAVTSAIAAACVRYRWTRDQFTEALIDWPSSGGNHVRNMSMPSAHKYLDKVWERARECVGAGVDIGSRQDAILDLIQLRDRITSASWCGTSGSTALRVLMAHWKAAYLAGGRVYTLAYREAAEMAGCTARTAYIATTQRLKGWIRLMESGSGEKGSEWMLIEDRSQQRHNPKGAQPGGAQSNVSNLRNGDLDGAVISQLMSLDAFAHRGLGASSLKLLAALSRQDGQTVAELTETAMVSPATAYKHLKRLAEHDLVTKEDGLWSLTQTATEALSGAWGGWDAVAAQVGTEGTAQRRQELHKAQRLVWHEITLPRLRERRMADVTPIRGDEVRPEWIVDGEVIDPVTGEVISDMVIASDGRLLLVEEEPSYEELVRMNQLAQAA